jgi:hypothetical protein
MDANRKADQDEWKAWREEMARRTRDKGTVACQELMEAHLEQERPTLLDTKPEVAQQCSVPKEDAKMMPVGGPNKRHRDWKLATEW